MITTTQTRILDRLLAYCAAGATVDAGKVFERSGADYTEIERSTRERDVLFRRYPLVAGFSRDLDGPGAFRTLDVAGVNVLLIRGRDGVARAFRNMCRHRGVQLVSEPCGAKKLFSCPFHAWSYDDVGALQVLPKQESFGEPPAGGRNLEQFALSERYGMLWLQLSGDLPDIDAWLGPLRAEIAGLELGARERMDGKVLEADINWKLALDTFGETYHFDSLHKNTLRPYFQSNVHDYETFGFHHRMVFAANAIEDLRDKAREDWAYFDRTLTAYFLFPNVQIIAISNHVDLFQIMPDTNIVGRSRTLYSYYPTPDFVTPSGGLDHKATFDLTALVIRHEDFATAETVQANLASHPGATLTFGRNEPALHHYCNTQKRALSGESAPR